MALAAADQPVQHPKGVRSPVNVIAEKNLDRPKHRIGRKISVDAEEYPVKQI
jgi:hypothetical protein